MTMLRLSPGENRLLVKITSMHGAHGFAFAVPGLTPSNPIRPGGAEWKPHRFYPGNEPYIAPSGRHRADNEALARRYEQACLAQDEIDVKDSPASQRAGYVTAIVRRLSLPGDAAAFLPKFDNDADMAQLQRLYFRTCRRRIYTWIDANVPYYGTYEVTDRRVVGGRDRWYVGDPNGWFQKEFLPVFNRRCMPCHERYVTPQTYNYNPGGSGKILVSSKLWTDTALRQFQLGHGRISFTGQIGPDRVPLMHDTLPGARSRYGAALEALYRKYPDDVVHVGSATSGEFGPEIGVPSRDPWGSLWLRQNDEHKGQVVFHPLADWTALDGYRTPDTASEETIADVQRKIHENNGRKYTLADGDTLWQRMYYLRGFQAANEDLLAEPERCAQLRDLILAVILRRLRRLAELDGLDGVHFRDDWGTQQALLIRPALWRAFFKPAYAQMFDVIRRSGKHVWFHSDGVTHQIIPDLIELGAQVLNPQCNCMTRQRLETLIAGKVCLLGDLDRQWTLPRGSPQDVRNAVREDIDTYGRHQGGMIARGEIAGDVPLENVEAMLDEMTRYGKDLNKKEEP